MIGWDNFDQTIKEMYECSLLTFVLLSGNNYALCQHKTDGYRQCWFPQDQPIPDDWLVIWHSLFQERPYTPKFGRSWSGRRIEVTEDGLERRI